MIHQDPYYGHAITHTWLRTRNLQDRGVPLYEYLGRYWDGGKWIEMLKHRRDLDFLGLAQRQQEKFKGFKYAKVWDCERGKWARRKTAQFKFDGEGGKDPGWR